jgi:hypothetical protein
MWYNVSDFILSICRNIGKNFMNKNLWCTENDWIRKFNCAPYDVLLKYKWFVKWWDYSKDICFSVLLFCVGCIKLFQYDIIEIIYDIMQNIYRVIFQLSL